MLSVRHWHGGDAVSGDLAPHAKTQLTHFRRGHTFLTEIYPSLPGRASTVQPGTRQSPTVMPITPQTAVNEVERRLAATEKRIADTKTRLEADEKELAEP